MTNIRKRKMVRVSVEVLVDLLKQGNTWQHGNRKDVITQGLPEDAEFVGFEPTYSPSTLTSVFCVASDSFEEVPEGAAAPELTITLQRKENEQ